MTLDRSAGLVAADETKKPAAVLVAQVGPGGSFGSGALLRDDAVATVTSTAAVDTEVYSLSRDAFQRIMKSKESKASSEALTALLALPALASMPRATLVGLGERAEKIELAAGAPLPAEAADGLAGAGDSFLLVVSSGGLTITDAAGGGGAGGGGAGGGGAGGGGAGGGASESTPAVAARFSPAASQPTAIGQAAALACGASAEEWLLAALFASVQEQAEAAAASTFSGSASEKPAASAAEAAAEAAAASEAASGRLRLLSGDATGQKWVVRADAATGAVAWLLPLRAVCAAVRASPLLLKNGAGPNLAVRALLMGQPLLAKLPAKTLDALSFAFNLLSHAQGALLTTEGIAAPRLHILLSGSATMRRRRAEPRRGSRLLSWLGQEDAEVAGGAGGGGGGRGGGGGGGGGAAGAAGRSDEASAESWPGDALGVRSIFGGASVEPATATARGTNTLTLTIDRSAALSLLPRDVASALRGRPDPLTLGEASAKLGLPSGLIMERVIARGGFGTVALGRHSASGVQYAVKKVRKALVEPPPLRRQILIERAALSAMSHPCICQLAGTYKTAICLYLVLELCDGPELYNVLQDDGPLAEASICSYGAEIVCALGALHERAWLYRDVKAENLVFTSHGHLKLVDLGLARRLPYGGRCFTVCGSSEYMAPEVVRQTGGYDFSADWWGVGCLLYEMRFTHTPWVVGDDGEVDATLTDNEISRNILDAARAVAFPPPPKDGTPLSEQLGALPLPSETFAALLRGLLIRQPAGRLGSRAAGAAEIRAHAFFGGVDWSAADAGKLPMPMPAPKKKGGSDEDGPQALGRLGSLAELDDDDDEAGEGAGGGGGGNDEKEEEEDLDPVSAQLVAFAKKRASQRASLAGGGAAPPPPTRKQSSIAPPRQWGWASSSGSSLGMGESFMSDSSDLESISVDGFFDGPEWEDEGDAWDREW